MIQLFKNLIRYKGLFYALLVRGFKAKYKNSCLGIFWSLLNPLLNVLIFAVIFICIIKINIKDYPLYLLCVIFPWNFFNSALLNGVVSIVEDSHFVKNMYLPVELLPLSVVVVNFLNFLIDLGILLLVLLFMGKASLVWLYIPVLAVVELILVSGITILLSGFFVFFRDLNFILNFSLRLFFYFVPVVYTLSFVPERWSFLYKLNPLAMVIDGFSQVLFSRKQPDVAWLLFASLAAAAVFFFSSLIFGKLKKTIPERL